MSKGSLPSLVTSSTFPVAAFEKQDSVFAKALALIQSAVDERVFPAATVAVTSCGQLVALKGFGRFTYDRASTPVTAESIFDLASVSKVVGTTSMAMLLYERGLLDLEMPVSSIVPEFAGDDRQRSEVTLRMLLAHSSGLPAYEKLFLREKSRAGLLAAAFSTPLSADPGMKAVYSDIGFIILGVALERLADESMDQFCRREVFGPLGMRSTAYKPPASWRDFTVPTADDQTFRHRVIQSEVQDENASVLEGVAGHAGIFANAEDVSRFAHCLLRGGASIFRADTITRFTTRESSPAGTSRALGWDTPSAPSQSGQYFSVSSFGHLGYTGTSLWIDPQRQISITLLTNRTWPDCANQAIKQLRPQIHDAIMQALGASF